VFAIDIELYPSVSIVSAFFDLLGREKKGLVPFIFNPHVYVLPVFEVKAEVEPPFKNQSSDNFLNQVIILI
jgi:hypothetical protein